MQMWINYKALIENTVIAKTFMQSKFSYGQAKFMFLVLIVTIA